MEIDRTLKESVEWAREQTWQKNSQMMKFILDNSQEIEPAVLNSHIETYVNEESLLLSEDGRAGIKRLFEVAEERGFIPKCDLPIFAGELK